MDPQYTDGAIATSAALTAAQGPFLLTTTLAKLAFVGIALQVLVLWETPAITRFGAVLAVTGCLLFLLFWDLDNWMLVGSVLLLAGFATVKPSRA